MISNDLNSTDNVTNTSSPQTAGGSDTGNNSGDFQRSADSSALNQYKTVQVEQTGEPITGVNALTHNTGAMIVFIIVSSIVLVMLASSVFRWVMKRPEPAPKLKEAQEKKADEPVSKKSDVKNSKGKAKKSRSQRKK